jgi:hypothetical protein
MPGQLGPTRRVLFWVFSMSVMRTMSRSYRLARIRCVKNGIARTVLGNTLSNAMTRIHC